MLEVDSKTQTLNILTVKIKDWFFILLFSLCVCTKHERNSLNEARVLRQLESEQYPKKADILTMLISHYYTQMHSSDSLKNDQIFYRK